MTERSCQITIKESVENSMIKKPNFNYKLDFYLNSIKTGHGYYRDESHYKNTASFYINDLFIEPKYRGKGYGSKCFDLLLKKVKEVAHGLPIYLEVEKTNIPAIKIYTKAGFEVFKEFEEDGRIYCRMFLGKPIDFESLSN